MKNYYYHRGFTLIELLVVIAIIGILSSVVLASLNSSRTKSADTAVKAALHQVRQAAEIYYDNHNWSYAPTTFTQATCPGYSSSGTNMFTDANISSSTAQAVYQGGNGSSCMSNGSAYAIAVGLKTTGQSWCIDSTGTAKLYVGTPTAAISNNKCN